MSLSTPASAPIVVIVADHWALNSDPGAVSSAARSWRNAT